MLFKASLTSTFALLLLVIALGSNNVEAKARAHPAREAATAAAQPEATFVPDERAIADVIRAFKYAAEQHERDAAKPSQKKSHEIGKRAYDPWDYFWFFNWDTWSYGNWGWYGHNLEYVKAWYYDEYGYSLPSGVYSWGQLSFYVSYFGTYNAGPGNSVYTAGGDNPWVEAPSTTSTSAKSTAASTSSSKAASSSSAAASSSSSKSSSVSSASASATSSVVAATSKVSSASSAAPTSSSAAVSSSSSKASSASAAASSSSSSSAAASSSSSKASSASAAASSSSSSSAAASSSSSSVASSLSSSSASKASSSSVAPIVVIPSISIAISSSTSTSTSTSAAATSTAPVAPTGWKVASTPCIAEGLTGRALLGSFQIDYANTIESCLAKCDAGGFPLGGMQYGNQCFCASYLSNGASLQRTATCSTPCAGDKTETCGGYYAISLFVSTKFNAAPLSADLLSVTINLPDGWAPATVPCIKEVPGRALTGASYTSDAMSVPSCLNFCAGQGYQYAALEFGRECYCGNAMDNGASLTSVSTVCGTPCAGSPITGCGGYNALQIYNNPAYSFSNTIVNGYVKTACIQEVGNRALRAAYYKDEQGMTVDTCTAYCSARGYAMAGLEYGGECYCGSSLLGGASLLLTSGQCYMSCVGDKTQQCGGPNAIWLYINPNPLKASIALPTGWTYKGCIAEGWTARALSFDASSYVKKGTMTGETCSSQCAQLGYTMAGTEYSTQCFCGNSFTGGATGAIIDSLTDSSSSCNFACPGNAAQMCGGSSRLSLYSSLASLPVVNAIGVAI
nr:uncharacterized protein CI109_002314 [Kwoniella shandongensis]KAA5529421.1 hypothetical protein CI109_002314 [Kwoniella shandongensis]